MWIAKRIFSARGSLIRTRTFTTDGRRLVLGIESSCDDSCAALVSAPITFPTTRDAKNRPIIHTSIVHKQDHGATRGIEPLSAANSHAANLPVAITEALRHAQKEGLLADHTRPHEIDAIAVTQGPGMAACLTQGLAMAKLLSTLWDRPLVYVHHMVAHTLTPLLTEYEESDTNQPSIRCPFLVLLLSGGHTQLVLCESFARFRILAATKDNSIGDAIDKAARTLNVPFDWSKTAPGAALESFARGGEDDFHFQFPVPVRGRAEFSYSGLISSVTRLIERSPDVLQDDAKLRSAAYAYQRAAFAQIVDKIKLALDDTKKNALGVRGTGITDLVVSGGVASNAFLRTTLRDTLKTLNREDVRLHFPPVHLCTDNAAMIAHAALVDWQPTRDLSKLPRARWSMEDYP